jgi:diguanylate cyclase (GGDEF)-like protein/PAS domain S-box-containing protein
MMYLCYIGATFLSGSLYYFGDKGIIGILIPFAILSGLFFVTLTKSDGMRFLFLTAANLFFILDIFLFQISFVDYLPLIYIILFINAFLLSNPLINLMYAFCYLMTVYQFKATIPNELLIGNFIGIIINSIIFTALALMVNKLKKDHELIREQELKYRTLFDFSADIIYLFELTEDDMPSKILEINDAACNKFGYSKEEILQMNPLQFTAQDRLDKIKGVQKELVEKGTISFEGKYITKSSQYIPSEITATVFKLENKRVVLAIARDISERKVLEDKLHYLAYYDSLTSLPNRDLLKNQIRNLNQGVQIAFLFVDLDGFKTINDTFGHDCGDQIIKLSAIKLRQCIDEQGLVTRFGGDEFLILLENTNIREVKEIAHSIINAFSEPIELQHHTANVTVSIGISFTTMGEQSVDVSIKEADQAMYMAKENGKNNFYIFEKNISLKEVST